MPTALHSGVNSGAAFCVFYGTHQPFDDHTLSELYSRYGQYVGAATRSAGKNLLERYITLGAALEIIAEAARAEVPSQ